MASEEHAHQLYDELIGNSDVSIGISFEEFLEMYWETWNRCHGED